MLQGDVGRIVEIVDIQDFLAARHALFGEHQTAVFFLQREVLLAFQHRDDRLNADVERRRLVGLAGYDERSPGLVDENGVHFVDDRVMQRPLHEMFLIELHVVAQVIEAELVVGPVGDVGPVGLLTLLVGQAVDDNANVQAEIPINGAHPLGVAPGQIVVDRDNVNALAAERVEHHGERGDKGFSFAGFHLGDAPLVQHDTADELRVKMPHVQGPPPGLADQGKHLGQQLVDRSAVDRLLAKRCNLSLKRGVVQGAQRRLQGIDPLYDRSQPLQIAIVF